MKSCGTCKWFLRREAGSGEPYVPHTLLGKRLYAIRQQAIDSGEMDTTGRCTYPVPEWVSFRGEPQWLRDTDGTDCPTHEDNDDGR